MSRTTLKALVDAGARAATAVLPALRRLLA
jgi:hypothetical protein